MRILAIDPGSTESGWLILNDGVIQNFGKHLNENMITNFSCYGEGIDITVIEEIKGFGRIASKYEFEAAFWSGRFYQKANGSVKLVSRPEIRKHWLGKRNGNDAMVREALINHFGGPVKIPTKGKAKNPFKLEPPEVLRGITKDCWSALAIALYAYRTKL